MFHQHQNNMPHLVLTLKKWTIMGFIGLLALPIALRSQSDSPNEKALEQVVSDLYTAMINKDQKTLEALTLPGLTYGHSSGIIENKSEYVEAVVAGPFDYLSIDPADQTLLFYGDTAIVRHIFNAKGKRNGEAVVLHLGVMMAFQHVNGLWKLLARQAYKL